MECREFLQLLDAFIDDELDAVQRKRMLEHADGCQSCARELNTARELSRMLAGLDADPVVPLAAQAAWRRAVKAESRKKRFNGFYRAVSGIAAAFVLMVGTTFAMRETGMLDHAAPSAASIPYAADYAYSGPARALSISDSASATAIEADGEADEMPAAGMRMIESDANQTAAEKETAAAGELLARSAMREIHTEDFDQAHAQIGDLAAEYGGYLMSDSVSTENGAQTAQIRAAVPQDDLDAFLAALDYTGTVTKSGIFAEDVTLDYYDAQGRLETLTAEKDRLNELIAAASAEELASLSAQLDEVYARIDEAESSVRSFESSIAFARVDITLYEGAAVPAAVKDDGLTQRMKNGFASTISAVKDFFADMAVSLAIIAPIAAIVIPLIAVIWIAVAVLLKRRQRRLEGRD